MEILSFILGMCAVLVIALAIVGVVALVKVLKLKQNYDNDVRELHLKINDVETNISKNIDELHQYMGREIENINQVTSREVNEIYRTIDSRFDKLSNKLCVTKEDAAISAKKLLCD